MRVAPEEVERPKQQDGQGLVFLELEGGAAENVVCRLLARRPVRWEDGGEREVDLPTIDVDELLCSLDMDFGGNWRGGGGESER